MGTTAVTVGSRSTLMTPAQRVTAGLQYFPDGNIAVRKNGAVYTFFAGQGAVASGDSRVVKTVGTLADPTATSATPIAVSHSSGCDYLAGGPIYADPGSSRLLMFLHGEIWPGGNVALYHTQCRLGLSSDGGASWTDIGQLLTPKFTTGVSMDMDGFPFALIDGYFYSFFEDRQDGSTLNSLSVARASVSAVVAGAAANTVTTWNKYSGGVWTELGIGGASATLESGSPAAGFFDVKWNTFTGTWWRVLTDLADSSNLAFQESRDGLTWTSRTRLVSGDVAAYPSIVGVDADPDVLGETFYVYYMHCPTGVFDWTLMNWVRRLVTVGSNRQAVPWARA